MPVNTPSIDEAEFFQYIEDGAARLTPREVHQLVSDLPELSAGFAKMRSSRYPETEAQLRFLGSVVEAVWTDVYRDMPYRAALEAAFAVSYFHRPVDLIPDSIEGMGLIDDAAVVQTVFSRNAEALHAFAVAARREWPAPLAQPAAS